MDYINIIGNVLYGFMLFTLFIVTPFSLIVLLLMDR